MIKFWMHLSHEEQGRRFKERAKEPLKRWKLTDEDIRNRDKRAQYEEAVVEMLERTDTSYAPWTVIEAEDKKFARVKVLETVIARVEESLVAHGIEIPVLNGRDVRIP